MILDVRKSLQISEECMLQRERRNGIELVRDNVERNLSKEVLRMRSSLDTLKKMLDKVNVQLKYATRWTSSAVWLVCIIHNTLRQTQYSYDQTKCSSHVTPVAYLVVNKCDTPAKQLGNWDSLPAALCLFYMVSQKVSKWVYEFISRCYNGLNQLASTVTKAPNHVG